jgi:hypothetical protein
MRELNQLLAKGILKDPRIGPDSVDLVRLVLKSLNCRTTGKMSFRPIPGLPERLEGPILFVIIDGLGMHLKEIWPEGGFFNTYFTTQLNSVFPSTTSCALCAVATGFWPANFGITGWNTYLPNYQKSLALLPYVYQNSEEHFKEAALEEILHLFSLLPLIPGGSAIISPDSTIAGVYSSWFCGGMPTYGYQKETEIPALIKTAFTTGAQFIYLYLPMVDHVQHHWGLFTDETARQIDLMDDLLTDIQASLAGKVTIIATADHGQIEIPTERQYFWDENHILKKMLSAPPSGEPAQPIFHVASGQENKFKVRFDEYYGDDFLLIPSFDLLNAGFFGREGHLEEMKARLGTYTAVGKSEAAAIHYAETGQEKKSFKGYHGGLRPFEMDVPLFLVLK